MSVHVCICDDMLPVAYLSTVVLFLLHLKFYQQSMCYIRHRNLVKRYQNEYGHTGLSHIVNQPTAKMRRFGLDLVKPVD